jgi:hypothetical protein
MRVSKMKKHYHYGAGMYGCLYDSGPYYAETAELAADALTQIFELEDEEVQELKRDRFLALKGPGVPDYCEITECRDDCNPEDYD